MYSNKFQHRAGIIVLAAAIILFLIFLLIYFTGILNPFSRNSISAHFKGNKSGYELQAPRTILYVNSYHPGYRWSDQLQGGIQSVLTGEFGKALDLRVEYLDAKRYGPFLKGAMGEEIASLWKMKYREVQFDLIVVSDQDGYNFLRKFRGRLFPGVPMVFSGVEDPGSIDPLTTGVLASTDYVENIKLIMKVLPKTERIWMISDNSETGRINRKIIEGLESGFKKSVEFRFFDDGKGTEPEELVSMAGRLKPYDVIFFLDYYNSKSGRYIDIGSFLPLLTEASTVPVFSHVDIYLDLGVTGGKMNSGSVQGQQLAELCIPVLNGVPAEGIAPQKENSIPAFNYVKLKQYGISESVLPDRSLVINRPDNFLHKYAGYFAGLASLITVETVLILWLVRLLRRQRELRTLSDEGEIALKQSEAKYRALSDTSSVGIWQVNSDNITEYVNPAMCEMLEIESPDELSGVVFTSFFTPESVERINREYSKREDDINSTYEVVLKGRKGGSRNLLVSGAPLLDSGSRLIGRLATFADITEWKRAEDELKAWISRYNLIVEASGQVAYEYVVQSGEITWGNSIEKVIGYKPEEMTGGFVQWQNMLHPDDMPAVISTLSDSEKNCSFWDASYRMKHRMGHWVWVRDRGFFLPDDSGKAIRQLGMIEDISGRIAAEEEKEKLHQQLMQSQKMESVGRLAGGVAHDFNNMLGAITGYAELGLMKINKADPLSRYFNEILKTAERSADLTRQLLAFARQQVIDPKIININNSVEGMLSMLRRLIGENIDLKWIPGNSLWPINADPTQIDQILANLSINARDAINGTGVITIRTENSIVDESYLSGIETINPGEYVVLSVNDNGSGMDRVTQERIFEPFFTTKELGHGTGLGLATVYGIVKQNRGFINVYSEPGIGSNFRIYLPGFSGGIVETEMADSTGIPSGRGETVLLVEDDPSLLELTKTVLGELNYDVLTSGSPEAAIDIASGYDGEINLILSDVIMPRMNGRTLAAKIEEIRPGIAFLFMSGYTADVIADQGIINNGINFIQKPFTMKELAVKLRAVLNLSK